MERKFIIITKITENNLQHLKIHLKIMIIDINHNTTFNAIESRHLHNYNFCKKQIITLQTTDITEIKIPRVVKHTFFLRMGCKYCLIWFVSLKIISIQSHTGKRNCPIKYFLYVFK